jgi:hypothetical protein
MYQDFYKEKSAYAGVTLARLRGKRAKHILAINQLLLHRFVRQFHPIAESLKSLRR